MARMIGLALSSAALSVIDVPPVVMCASLPKKH
jgi:hypothetical protein